VSSIISLVYSWHFGIPDTYFVMWKLTVCILDLLVFPWSLWPNNSIYICIYILPSDILPCRASFCLCSINMWIWENMIKWTKKETYFTLLKLILHFWITLLQVACLKVFIAAVVPIQASRDYWRCSGRMHGQSSWHDRSTANMMLAACWSGSCETSQSLYLPQIYTLSCVRLQVYPTDSDCRLSQLWDTGKFWFMYV
jgi:hypothetical protein